MILEGSHGRLARDVDDRLAHRTAASIGCVHVWHRGKCLEQLKRTPPPPASIMALANICDTCITARTLIANSESKSSVLASRNGPLIAMAALLTSRGHGPAAKTASIDAATALASLRSQTNASQPSISAQRESRSDCVRDSATTFAPHAASSLQSSRPIPLPAPVTCAHTTAAQ